MRISTRLATLLAALALLSVVAATSSAQTNWPQWRGPRDNGSSEGGTYPIKWDSDKVLWKAPLPGKGCSTPIVWNQRIFLTAPSNGLDAALAFDWSGKQLWQTSFGPENAGRHRNGSGSNPSPVTDGRSVFVYFKSGTFAALDFDGKVLWQTNLVAGFGPETFYWDHGTSPVLTEKYVVMTRMHHGESWVAAFDKNSGDLRWKVPRNYETPVEGDHSYATPGVIQYQGQEALLVWGAEHLTLHDTADGKLLWSCTADFNPDRKPNWPNVASVVVSGDIAIVASARADHGQPRLHGIKLGAVPDSYRVSLHTPEGSKFDNVSNSPPTYRDGGQVLWKRTDTGTYVPTPAIYKNRVYIVRDRGEVECLNPATGQTIWSAAFPKSSANFYASPIIAGGNLYAIREDGAAFVARIEEGKFQLLAENSMGEHVIASTVPLSNRLFIRGEQHLFCIE